MIVVKEHAAGRVAQAVLLDNGVVQILLDGKPLAERPRQRAIELVCFWDTARAMADLSPLVRHRDRLSLAQRAHRERMRSRVQSGDDVPFSLFM